MDKLYSDLAKYYDLIYSLKDYEEEAKKIRIWIDKYKKTVDNTLLDVACGTGGHIQFLKKHYEVTGIDLSEAMLSFAERRNPDIVFYKQDMRCLDLKSKFAAIICLFGSISYLLSISDIEETAISFFKHLIPGGIALVEPIFYKEDYRPDHIGLHTVDNPDVKIARIDISEKKEDYIILDFRYLIATPDGIEYYEDPNKIGLINKIDFKKTFKKAGFETEFIEGGFGRSDILLCKKPK